jgi:uncharacterized delta-60 repeat protein
MPLIATKSAYTEGESITITASASGPSGTSSTLTLFVSGISPSDTSVSLAGSTGNYSISKTIAFGTTGIGSATFTIPTLNDGIAEGIENWSFQLRDGSILNLSVEDQSIQPDTTAPTVSSFSPADAATGVALGSNITLTFNEGIQRGTGNIEIRQGSATGSLVESFNVATSNRVSLSGTTLTLDPTSNLLSATKYFVVLPSGVVRDLASNSYAGTSIYEFTTASTDTSPPIVLSLSPSDDATNIPTNADILIKFSENIQRGEGIIYLREASATGRIIEQYDAAGSTQLSFYGSWLKINPRAELTYDTKYFITISNNSIKDTSGNFFVGTSDYKFTTESPLMTQPGTNSLPTFNKGFGIVSIPSVSITSWSEKAAFWIFDIAISSNGSILIGGNVRSGTGADLALARYDINGNFDSTFSGDGALTYTVSDFIRPYPNSAIAYSVIAQDDGKVILGGGSTSTLTWATTLVRLNPDGSLDGTFSNDGVVTSVIGTGSEYSRLAIQADGKILASGFCKVGSGEDIYVARLNTDGTFDTQFGKNKSGVVITGIGSGSDRAYDIAVQADGKIVVGGISNISGEDRFTVARYTITGDLDTTFDLDGITSTSVGQQADARRIGIQNNGKIVVAGSIGSNRNPILVRYNSDGSLDTSFDGDGILNLPWQGFTSDLDIQVDGKLVICTGNSVYRLNPNGTPDVAFGDGGLIQASASQCEIQADGRLVVSGRSLSRYLQNGKIDTTFGGSSTLATRELSYLEGGPAIVLADSVEISDLNLNQAGTYQGSTVELVRKGGSNTSDVFSIKGIGSPITDGASIDIGTILKNSDGQLKILFNQNSYQATVNQLLQSIEYKNTSDSPDLSVIIDWNFSDGNEGLQGSGVQGTVTGYTKIGIIPVNDLPSGSVTISGNTRKGQTLSASNTISDIDGLDSIKYTWKDGSTILGTGSTYTLSQADVGRRIFVSASYIDAFGTAEEVVSTTTSEIENVNDPPSGTVTILGSGAKRQGQTLRASHSIADADGVGAITYTWKSGDTTLAVGAEYLLTQADVSKVVRLEASYTDGFGNRETVIGGQTLPIENVNDSPNGVVAINGTARQGQTLIASHTLADIDGLGAISYIWKAGTTTLGTGNTYTLSQADVGKSIVVVASFTDGQGTTESVTSSLTGIVESVTNNTSKNPTPTSRDRAPKVKVAIEGSFSQGQALSVSTTVDKPEGIGPISYQWYADGKPITGETRDSLVLLQAYIGKNINVLALYTNNYGKVRYAWGSNSSSVTDVNDNPTGEINLLGSSIDGQVLTANASSLIDIDGLGTLQYQWQRSVDGSDWQSVRGAKAIQYKLGNTDVGKHLRVNVSYVDKMGYKENVTSIVSELVSNVNDKPMGLPRIFGNLVEGGKLTAITQGLIDGDGLGEFSYIWQLSSDGTTWRDVGEGSTLELDRASAGNFVQLTVNYTDGHGYAESVKSNRSAPIAAGSKYLEGNADANLLVGMSGADMLYGGGGADSLTGGAGNDVFIFSAISDLPLDSPDRISDFSAGDKINLSGIDANLASKFDQAFVFSKSGPRKNAVWWDEGTLYGDNNGDATADFAIAVTLVGISEIKATDVIL